MYVSFDTEKLTDADRQVLQMLGGEAPKTVAAPKVDVVPTTTRKQAEPEPEPDPTPDPIVPDADEADDTPAPTLQDAVDLASTLVSKGRAADVKTALTKLGAAKVSKLEGPTAIAAFIAELS